MENLKDMPNLENVEKREAIPTKIVNLIKDRNTLRTEYNKRLTRKLKSITVNDYQSGSKKNEHHIKKPNNQKMVSISTNLTEKLIISLVSLSWYIVLAMIRYKRICKFFQNFTKFFR